MIEQAIKSYYGERCPDHAADCVVCQAWEQWDKIRRPYNKAIDHVINTQLLEEGINSEDLKCNTCGDYVGEEGVWGLCETCFDKEGGNEAIEYVYKPLSKEALAEVAQFEPRPNPWLKSQYATEKEE